ncbi:MAG: SIS domain-containing protein [Candidatus Brocadiia bacterium]
MKERIERILRASAEVHQRLVERSGLIEDIARRLVDVLSGGGAVYVMGNGGSAADAQHLAGELVGRFLMERRPLPCHALTTDTSVLTAVANDYGFEQVFEKQVRAHVRPGDAVIGISTSGNSANVLAGVRAAKEIGALTVGLSGAGGGALAAECDVTLAVPADETPRVQEGHATVIHILCELIEDGLFGTEA